MTGNSKQVLGLPTIRITIIITFAYVFLRYISNFSIAIDKDFEKFFVGFADARSTTANYQVTNTTRPDAIMYSKFRSYFITPAYFTGLFTNKNSDANILIYRYLSYRYHLRGFSLITNLRLA